MLKKFKEYKMVIWDFDGVIKESIVIKSNAFEKLFQPFGEKISGEGYIEPTAFNIHGAIHKRKTDANCVMHTHMQSTLALSMLVDGKLEMSDQNACRFYNRIAYMNDYNGLVLDDLEANKIVDALGNKDILFLACHGVIVVGKDVSNAWEDLYYLDRACRAQLLAMQTGKPLRKISDEIALKVSKQVSEETLSESSNAKRHLESLRKILVNEGINEFNVNS